MAASRGAAMVRPLANLIAASGLVSVRGRGNPSESLENSQFLKANCSRAANSTLRSGVFVLMLSHCSHAQRVRGGVEWRRDG